ncbi:hypothetical protein [Streptomyces sp. NPDC054834]
MEFRIERGDLAEAVGWAARALPARLLGAGQRALLSSGREDGEDGGDGESFEAHRHLLMSVKQLV